MNNATKKWVEDAIAGGWNTYRDHFINVRGDGLPYREFNEYVVAATLLDPLAWQAVGKTRGWVEKTYWTMENEVKIILLDTWQNQWHTFIQDLADGKTINEALQAIS